MTVVALISRFERDRYALPSGAKLCPRTENKHIQNVTHCLKVNSNTKCVSLNGWIHLEIVSYSLKLQCAITPFSIVSSKIFPFRN